MKMGSNKVLLTLKIARPLLRRRALDNSRSGGGGEAASGVSMRSLRPYLCGLSSGMGEGAGIVGDNAETRRCVGESCSAESGVWLSGCRPVMVPLALIGLAALSSVRVADGDTGCIGIEGEGAE
jgi:hypothetical protein